MNAMNRLKVIMVSTNIKLLLLMGFLYGLVFGGVSQGFALAQGGTSLYKVIASILMIGAAYECMFLLVILIVLVALNIKGYISLGMDQLIVYKIWRDFLIYVSLFMVIVANIFIWTETFKNQLFMKTRVLNINFNNLETLDYLKVFLIVTLSILLLNMSVSLITSIGNRFGIVNCFVAITVFVGFFILSIPKIIDLILWGDRLAIIMVVLVVLNVIFFGVSKNLIKNTEVAR